jgi:protein-tyrosine phosphatase
LRKPESRIVFESVLIVCLGNVCRSPVAEFLFRDAFAGRGIRVGSAGLGALVGQPLAAEARAWLDGRGIDASTHRARQLDMAMLRDATLVLSVEASQLRALARCAPQYSGKCFLLSRWDGGGDIPDPYRRPRHVFAETHASIERAVHGWIHRL